MAGLTPAGGAGRNHPGEVSHSRPGWIWPGGRSHPWSGPEREMQLVLIRSRPDSDGDSPATGIGPMASVGGKYTLFVGPTARGYV